MLYLRSSGRRFVSLFPSVLCRHATFFTHAREILTRPACVREMLWRIFITHNTRSARVCVYGWATAGARASYEISMTYTSPVASRCAHTGIRLGDFSCFHARGPRPTAALGFEIYLILNTTVKLNWVFIFVVMIRWTVINQRDARTSTGGPTSVTASVTAVVCGWGREMRARGGP